MASVHTSWRPVPNVSPPFLGHMNVPFSPPTIIPPFWDDRIAIEQNLKRMVEENRLQILESRQQMAEIRNLLSTILRSIDISQVHISELERKMDKGNSLSWEDTSTSSLALFTPPKRPLSIAPHNFPLSPTPTVSTDSSEPLYENPDLDLKWNTPAWLGEDIIDHPYRSRLILPLSKELPEGQRSHSQNLLHALPLDHVPDELIHSPFGQVGEQSPLSIDQEGLLSVRRIDTDERTMSYINAECDRHPIRLGGLYEPIIHGRFPDEPDTKQAHVFRARRWGINSTLHLHRLPRRELLLPDNAQEAPNEMLKKRHKTWYFTYRVWYSFVNNVGPARFPGLLNESWETILESPPEEARTKFSEALYQYAGYIGTSVTVPRSDKLHLHNLVPDLLFAFDQAVQSPWPNQKPLTDLIIDLDDFESQRELETRDATRLWRGILWNTFPKHCMKHIRVGSVGGSDSRWGIVHAEFLERLNSRRALWESMGSYRFPQGAYLPNATASRVFTREQRLKQMVHESTVFASILLCWKDGPLHLKHAVVPSLTAFDKQVDPLDDTQLDQWQCLSRTVQHFYHWKCDRLDSTQG